MPEKGQSRRILARPTARRDLVTPLGLVAPKNIALAFYARRHWLSWLPMSEAIAEKNLCAWSV